MVPSGREVGNRDARQRERRERRARARAVPVRWPGRTAAVPSPNRATGVPGDRVRLERQLVVAARGHEQDALLDALAHIDEHVVRCVQPANAAGVEHRVVAPQMDERRIQVDRVGRCVHAIPRHGGARLLAVVADQAELVAGEDDGDARHRDRETERDGNRARLRVGEKARRIVRVERIHVVQAHPPRETRPRTGCAHGRPRHPCSSGSFRTAARSSSTRAARSTASPRSAG